MPLVTFSGPDRPVSRQTEDFTRTLVEPWAVEWCPTPSVTHRIVLPAGIDYNPSAPGVTHALVPVSRMMVASLPHDVLYKLQGEAEGYVINTKNYQSPEMPLSRAYADRLFKQIMARCGVAPWRRQAAYWSVRAFGWAAWNENDSPNYPDPPYGPSRW